jgi:hypothetical protein
MAKAVALPAAAQGAHYREFVAAILADPLVLVVSARRNATYAHLDLALRRCERAPRQTFRDAWYAHREGRRTFLAARVGTLRFTFAHLLRSVAVGRRLNPHRVGQTPTEVKLEYRRAALERAVSALNAETWRLCEAALVPSKEDLAEVARAFATPRARPGPMQWRAATRTEARLRAQVRGGKV